MSKKTLKQIKAERIEKLKVEYIGKEFGWLTVIDVVRNPNGLIEFSCKCRCGNMTSGRWDKIKSGHKMSCGCYQKSQENSKRHKELYDNYDHKEINNKMRTWIADNPDKIKQRNDKLKKEKPPGEYDGMSDEEKRTAIGKKISYKKKQWYVDNKEKSEETRNKLVKYYEDNDEKKSEIVAKRHAGEVIKRSRLTFKELLEIIHSNYVKDLTNGILTSSDMILTKCQLCGLYDYHMLGNVYSLTYDKLKRNTAPLCCNCKYIITASKAENEITDFISTFYNGECIRNTRDVISPLELDLYYPEKKIAIEFNGDYWHNEDHKPKNYHFNKFIQCKMNGVFLISIFETEWNCNTKAIKQYLYDTFNNKSNKLSYNDEYMNNNYPDITALFCDYSRHIEHSYLYRGKLIYTCGYTEISV
jgi:hypothetical protein